VLKSQHRITGDVTLPGPKATLHLGEKYYFLGPDDARQVLKEWGNPPSAADGVLGIVFPADKSFVYDTWGAVITYEDAGYIADKDADKADYNKFVEDVRKSEPDDNAQRKKDGFAPIHLVGWAQPPSYDKARHYMIWARDLKFGDQQDDTLNYDVRLLGRRGFLSLNLVSTMSKLPTVRADAATLAGDAVFDPGSLYTEFDASKDKKAEYGIAGLVAAGLGLAAAQKFGLLAIILLFAKKFLVVILAGFAGAAAWVRRLFNRQPKPSDGPGAGTVS
jgi:uncharacterized membrane-anchored protein